jgi:hypothetical protein
MRHRVVIFDVFISPDLAEDPTTKSAQVRERHLSVYHYVSVFMCVLSKQSSAVARWVAACSSTSGRRRSSRRAPAHFTTRVRLSVIVVSSCLSSVSFTGDAGGGRSLSPRSRGLSPRSRPAASDVSLHPSFLIPLFVFVI